MFQDIQEHLKQTDKQKASKETNKLNQRANYQTT